MGVTKTESLNFR